MSTSFREKLLARTTSLFYEKSIKQIPENICSIQGHIKDLIIYPFKGLTGVHVNEAYIGVAGLESARVSMKDRMAMLVEMVPRRGYRYSDAYDCKGLSQKNERKLAAIDLQYSADEEELLLQDTTSNQDAIHVPLDELQACEGPTISVLMPGKAVEVVQGVLLDQSIDFVQKINAMLVGSGPENFGKIGVLVGHSEHERYADTFDEEDSAGNLTRFSDGGKLHLTNEQSREYINQHLPEVPMSAFRPNIVVDGWLSNMEDLVHSAEIVTGDGRIECLAFSRVTPRCIVPCLEKVDGEVRVRKDVLPWLREHRPIPPWERSKNPTPNFGMNVGTHEEISSIISVGDPISALEERENWQEQY